MAQLSPAQRTAGTARILLIVGLVCAIEALLRDSVTRTVIATGLLVFGSGLLFAAKRAD